MNNYDLDLLKVVGKKYVPNGGSRVICHNMTMDKQPFEDVSPIKPGDFPC